MPLRQLVWVLLLVLSSLSACSRDTPEAALEKAVVLLQENLESKSSSAVLEQLHGQFAAQGQYDRDWAKRTMTLLFLRHKSVQVIALSKHSEIDPVYRDKGHSRVQIAMTGAEGLIPDSARHYSVDLEWWLEDGEWRLARLDWK